MKHLLICIVSAALLTTTVTAKNNDRENFNLTGSVERNTINFPDEILIEVTDEKTRKEEKSKMPFPFPYLDGGKIYWLGIKKNKEILEEGVIKNAWEFIKGNPINNSLLLGMFSHHTSNTNHNETHNLVGLDYKGYSVGTFSNSYSDQTFYAGISRKLYNFEFKDYSFDVKYKLVAMHGYGDRYPNLAGITPVLMPIFGISRGHAGIDFIAVPDKNPTFSVNFRINLPEKILKHKND